MRKTILFLLPFCLLACEKKVSSLSGSGNLISQAQIFFSDSIANRGQAVNYRAEQARSVQWDLAQVIPLKKGQGVLAPIVYSEPMMVKANFSGEFYFHLNYLTQLLVFKYADSAEKALVITSFPDSNFFKNPNGKFTGIKFIEDWQGHPVSKLLYGADGTIKKYVEMTKEVAALEVIETCYTISGYNYSADDPDNGYYWTESAGCSGSFIESDDGGVGAGAGASGSGGGGSAGSGIALANGNNVIGNIIDYLKCFSNYGGTDHSYQVTICVSQPVPGSSTPWTTTPGGPAGSSDAGNPVDVGHTYLVFSEIFSGYSIVRNVGFYPQATVYPWSPSSQGQLNNDAGHDYNISLTMTVDNGQFFNMLNFIDQGNNAGYMYNLNTNNCTTFSLQALDAGGVILPSTVGTWPGGGIGNDPGDLGEDIRGMQLSSNMTRNTTYSARPNLYTCN